MNDAQLRGLKAAAKPYRVTDRDGLYVWVTPKGTKSFRCAYQVDGARKTCVLGAFPEMSLSAAREARLGVRKAVKAGRDPNRERRIERESAHDADAATFEVVARNWHLAKSQQGKSSPLYAKQILLRLERRAFPKLGPLPIAAIDDRLVERFIREAHREVPAVAEKLRKDLCPIFDYAIRRRLTATNPIRVALPDLPVHSDGRNQPSVKTIEAARVVVHAVERTNLMPPVLLYHRLIALTGVRESAARLARWSEFATPGEWTIPAERMKGKRGKKRALTLPLSRQAEDVLAAAGALADQTGGRRDLVFRSLMGKRQACAPYTLNSAMKPALRRAGIVENDGRVAHVPHGWRATFVTVMKKRHPDMANVLQAMIGHVVRGVAGDYDHSSADLAVSDFARSLAQEWADALLERESSAFALVGLPAPSNIVPFPTRKAPIAVAEEPRAASGLRRRLRSPQV